MVQFRVLVNISSVSSNFTNPVWDQSGNVIWGSCEGQISIETATYSWHENFSVLRQTLLCQSEVSFPAVQLLLICSLCQVQKVLRIKTVSTSKNWKSDPGKTKARKRRHSTSAIWWLFRSNCCHPEHQSRSKEGSGQLCTEEFSRSVHWRQTCHR